MRCFVLTISVVALIVGSQAAPQFGNFNLGDLVEGARNQVRNAISQIRNPFLRNDVRHRPNTLFEQPYRPNNNYDRPMNQVDQALWAQCANLFAAHPQRDWRNPNPSNIYNGFVMGQFDANYPGQMPSVGFNGAWEAQQIPGVPQYQSNGGEPCPENCQRATPMTTTTTTNVDLAELVVADTDTTAATIAQTVTNENRIAVTPNQDDNEQPVSSTTEFDWDHFYLGASVNNTGGVGSIDVRGDFK